MKQQRTVYTTFKEPGGERPRMIPRIGKIGLGIKVETAKGKSRPKECDYFVLDDPSCHVIVDWFLENGFLGDGDKAAQEKAEKWKAGKGGPKSLPILFTEDDPALVAPKSLERWGNGIKLCSGNGVEAQQLLIESGKTIGIDPDPIVCPCECLDTGTCKRQIRLMVMIPHVTTAGCFQIDSTSRATIGNIYTDLEQIANFAGRISWLLDPEDGEPLLSMHRVPWTSTKDKRTHHAIQIRMRNISLAKLAEYRGLAVSNLLPGGELTSWGQENLCLSCHNKPLKSGGGQVLNMAQLLLDNPNHHGPIAQKDCTSCHGVHGGENFRMLVEAFPAGFYAPFDEDRYALCFSCHEPELALDEETDTTTNFRNGKENLHYRHVNRKVKGRTCRACHNVHASRREKFITETVPFGEWQLPLNYQQTSTGGSCQPGCHRKYRYDREKPVVNVPKS